ncbi:hypothetical protein BJ170DRAFT_685608 [Xylariales sp. AK1849]|nr:hypothetical protein BJ170DRAFT_685608 [Xylariales sp. AK1849]
MAIQSAALSGYTTTSSKSPSCELKSADPDIRRVNLKMEYGPQLLSVPDSAADMLGRIKQNAVRLLNRPWQKRQVKWNQDQWNILENNSERYDTQSLMISCGTVTIDRAATVDRRILLIWNRNTAAWQLPKGRKNVHEDFSVAALRETTEETGIVVRPLYLRFGTRFTLPEKEEEESAERLRKRSNINHHGVHRDNGIVDVLNKDVFCASQYPDPATGAMRHIYWYAARPEDITPNLNLMGEDDIPMMVTQWFSAAEAVNRLKMSVEKEAVALAVHYAEQMSDEEWKYSFELSGPSG